MNPARAHRITGLAVAAAVFGLYAVTAHPTVAFWDNGELITASAGLGVPHASTSVLFLLFARLLAPAQQFFEWATLVNLLNAFLAALAIAAVYAAVVELLRGENEDAFAAGASRAAPVAGAVAAALFLALSDSFWTAATTSGGAAPAMLLLALMVFVALRWLRTATEIGSSRWLLLLAFLIGLSTTVQRDLVLIAMPVSLLVIVRTARTRARAAILALSVSALLVLEAETTATALPAGLAVAVFGPDAGPLALGGTLILVALSLLLCGTVLAFMTGRSAPYFAALCGMLYLAGLSPGLMVPLRASQRPAFDMGHPATADRYAVWLAGSAEPAPVLDLAARVKNGVRDQFLRYFLWNTVGRAGDRIGAPPVFLPGSPDRDFPGQNRWTRSPLAFPVTLFGIPLLVGLAGLFRQYRHDPVAALFLLAVFFACGPLQGFLHGGATPLARETDGRYAGALLVMALWIGTGIAWFVAALTRRSAHATRTERGAALSIALALPALFFCFQYLAACPGHDRHMNFTARDAACNMLQSCDSNAVLFTEGDNDTFPLLYAQDVLGVRPDVRVVNLGLLSEEWYCLQQIAPRTDGRPRLPATFTAAQIGAFARMDRAALLGVSSPGEWQDVSIPVDRRTMARFLAESMEGLPKAVVDSLSRERAVAALAYRVHAPYPVAADSAGVDFRFARSLRDLMTDEIIRRSAWRRPVYFSVFCSHESLNGLEANLRLEGLAMRLTPVRTSGEGAVRASVLGANLLLGRGEPSRHLRRGFVLAGTRDAPAYRDPTDFAIRDAHRNAYLRLAAYRLDVLRDRPGALLSLKACEDALLVDATDFRVQFDMGALFFRAGDEATARRYFSGVERAAWRSARSGESGVQGLDSPYRYLLEIARMTGDTGKALAVLDAMRARSPNADDIARARAALLPGYQTQLSDSQP